MQFSIITATCNSESVVAANVASIATQWHPDLEHVVVDAQSSDRTLEVLRTSQRPPDRVISEPDQGIYDALNKGIQAANGDVVGFLHSDDWFASDDVLERVAEIFDREGCDAVYGDLEYVMAGEGETVIRYWRGKAYAPGLLRWGWMPAHPTLFLRRAVYNRLGGFDLRYRIAGDYEAMLRYFRSDLHAVYLPKVLVSMRLGGVSNRSVAALIKKMREDYRVIREHDIGGLFTLACKNLRKVSQFWDRRA